MASARVVNNTGVSGAAQFGSAPVQSTASVYLAIGEALPSPAPETIQEVRVNTSMYDAQQGSTSGAHIDLSTASGTNTIHGQRLPASRNQWLNAAPFFFNQDPNIPASEKNPELHRVTPGCHAWTARSSRTRFSVHRLPARSRFRSGDRHIADDGSAIEFTAANCGATRPTAKTEAWSIQCLTNLVVPQQLRRGRSAGDRSPRRKLQPDRTGAASI